VDGKDFYEILQIQLTASQEEVKSAYKRLALLYHPDLSSHPQATLLMQSLNEAFEVLGSQEKRAQYDQDRLSAAAPEPVKVEPDPTSPTQPVSTVQKEQDSPEQAPKEPARREPDPRLYGWIRNQLKIFVWIMGLTMFLFLWSLIAGRVSPVAVLVLVLLSVSVVASIVMRIRRPAPRSR
jgi:curved DNA-binding protein CbpA